MKIEYKEALDDKKAYLAPGFPFWLAAGWWKLAQLRYVIYQHQFEMHYILAPVGITANGASGKMANLNSCERIWLEPPSPVSGSHKQMALVYIDPTDQTFWQVIVVAFD